MSGQTDGTGINEKKRWTTRGNNNTIGSAAVVAATEMVCDSNAMF